MHVSGCWCCGAGFGHEDDWKPVASPRAPAQPIEYTEFFGWRGIAAFTAPVWGIVLATLVLSVIAPNGGNVLLFIGSFLPFGFMPRIWDTVPFGWIGTLFLSVAYYAMSCVAMFLAGWMTLLYVNGPT